MPALPRTQTWLHAVAVATVTAGTLIGFPLLFGPTSGTAERAMRSPVVAAAWAQLQCDPGLRLRTQPIAIFRDHLLEGAAAFEAQREQHGLGPVCTQALQAARPVIDSTSAVNHPSTQPPDGTRSAQAMAAN
jgi:hypothetical protein